MEIKSIIESHIRKRGYASVDEFMKIAMSEQSNSYYRKNNPIGENSDFVTAPEISQMFGEMIALWAIDAWHSLGSPVKCNIIEFGAGTGKLMRDFLKIAKIEKAFYESINIQIIDINQTLIELQKNTISENIKIEWIKSLDKAKNLPTIIIANEFFDALPIKQFHLNNNVWREKVISLDDKNNFEFLFKDIEKNEQERLQTLTPNAQNNGLYEESTESQNLMNQIAKLIKINGGSALIVDYGYDIEPSKRLKNQYTSSLQAISKHKYVSVFEDLGNADLTSHVDFYNLKNQAKKYNLKTYGAIGQGDFLKNCGIDFRLNLLQKANPNLAATLKKQYNRLVSPNQMGELFKVISISSSITQPIGFK